VFFLAFFPQTYSNEHKCVMGQSHPINFIFKPTGQMFSKMKFTGDSHQKLSLGKQILAQTVNYTAHCIISLNLT